MRTSTRNLALAASAVLALTVAGGAAMAQTPPPPAPPAPPAPPMPPMDAMMAGGPHMVFMNMMHGPHGDPAAHAQHLRDVLQLRPDQEGALKTYLEGSAPKAMHEMIKEDRPDDDDNKPLTTPERLDRQAARMAEMAAMFQKRTAVTKAFYAALSPSQQKAFDALGPEMGGPRMEMRRIETRHEGPSLGGERRVIIQRKAG
ncbi:Spy/CpxP family protein refolding chaperone [Caulobacter sp.]|uniref:Spy/CpxP family protein refolding chaperone n=1 Tax=Caulobacter sp. TaxID=78 RepID=UPI003BAB0F91